MPSAPGAEKRACADNHEFREHRATPQMGSAAVLQRSLPDFSYKTRRLGTGFRYGTRCSA